MIGSGCRCGISVRGGRPKQCGQPVVANATINDGSGSLRTLPVCLRHYQALMDRRQATEYTEDAKGTPAPKRVTLIR